MQLPARRLPSPLTLLGSMINFEAIAHQEQNQPADTDLVTNGRDIRNHNLTDDSMNQRRTATAVHFEAEQSTQEMKTIHIVQNSPLLYCILSQFVSSVCQ